MKTTVIDICRPGVISILALILSCSLQPGISFSSSNEIKAYEILIHTGKVSESIEIFKNRDYWGAEGHATDLDVPRIIIVATSNRWEEESQNIEVDVKKEFFFRAIVPMILLSNELILKDRAEIETIGRQVKKTGMINSEQQTRLASFAEEYGLEETTAPGELISQLLESVDTIPPSLALGQAAYESGYATSRFAREGNALFGQWTYSGDGMKPEEHRASKGNYGVASYRWPFDSVRSYMRNLNTHGAYQALRNIRAALREQGKEPTGLELADALESYSEKGTEYVETLKDIITTNNLAIMDQAYLRDEPITLAVGVTSEQEAAEVESKIEELRASGELGRIFKEMRLE